MKLVNLMAVKSIICWIFGFSMLIVPVRSMAFFGIEVMEGGALMTRLFGAAFIVLALWLGLARETEDDISRRAVCAGVTVGDTLGAIVMIYALLTGTGNDFAWFVAALYLILAVLFGYYLVAQPEGKFAV